MDTLTNELLDVHHKITVNDVDPRTYTEMLDMISNWLTSEMCEVDACFKEIFKGTKLFGSYQNRVPIASPSEFDVLILLDFNFPLRICPGQEIPGFIQIRTKNSWKNLKDDDVKVKYREIFQERKRGSVLRRNWFFKWIHDIAKNVLENSKRPTGYEIDYNNYKTNFNINNDDNNNYINRIANDKGVVYTVKVKELIEPYKKISIHFIAALELDEKDVCAVVRRKTINFGNDDDDKYRKTFVALPKPLTRCGSKKTKRFSFQLVNPDVEQDLLWDKQNLKVVYRLLTSLRNNYKKLRRLRCTFLTAMFLREVAQRKATFWQESIGYIFIEMLKKLIDYCNKGNLPFYWSAKYNLFVSLKRREVPKFAETLTDAYNKLTKLDCVRDVKYTVASYFKTTPREFVKKPEKKIQTDSCPRPSATGCPYRLCQRQCHFNVEYAIR